MKRQIILPSALLLCAVLFFSTGCTDKHVINEPTLKSEHRKTQAFMDSKAVYDEAGWFLYVKTRPGANRIVSMIISDIEPSVCELGAVSDKFEFSSGNTNLEFSALKAGLTVIRVRTESPVFRTGLEAPYLNYNPVVNYLEAVEKNNKLGIQDYVLGLPEIKKDTSIEGLLK